MKKIFFLIIINGFIFSIKGQSPTKGTSFNKFKCTNYVYNLSTGDMKIRDICYSVKIISHTDLSEFKTTPKNKEDEFWKFDISIIDNQKLTKQNTENAEKLQKEKQIHVSIVEVRYE